MCGLATPIAIGTETPATACHPPPKALYSYTTAINWFRVVLANVNSDSNRLALSTQHIEITVLPSLVTKIGEAILYDDCRAVTCCSSAVRCSAAFCTAINASSTP